MPKQNANRTLFPFRTHLIELTQKKNICYSSLPVLQSCQLGYWNFYIPCQQYGIKSQRSLVAAREFAKIEIARTLVVFCRPVKCSQPSQLEKGVFNANKIYPTKRRKSLGTLFLLHSKVKYYSVRLRRTFLLF